MVYSGDCISLIISVICRLHYNPGRFKEIVGFPYNLFRIRFYDNNKSKRLVYAIDKEYIKLLCIINRDKNYKDLNKYIKMIKRDGDL